MSPPKSTHKRLSQPFMEFLRTGLNFKNGAIIVLMASFGSSSAINAAGKIGYGSRIGMDVDVVSMTGLDTTKSRITTRHTRENAIEFCREYIGSVTEDCIKSELATRLNDFVEADCIRGVFTNFWG